MCDSTVDKGKDMKAYWVNTVAAAIYWASPCARHVDKLKHWEQP